MQSLSVPLRKPRVLAGSVVVLGAASVSAESSPRSKQGLSQRGLEPLLDKAWASIGGLLMFTSTAVRVG